MAFRPNGLQVSFGHPDGSVRLHDLASGRERQRLDPELTPALLQFHPTGDQLAAAEPGSKEVHLVSLGTGEVTSRLVHGGGVTVLTWYPDGRYLATANPGTITIWEPEAGAEQRFSWKSPSLALVPRWSSARAAT